MYNIFLNIHLLLNKILIDLFTDNDYNLILKIFIIIFFINSLLIIIPYLFNGRYTKNIEKISEYECGFEPSDSATQHPFTTHPYIIGILFLIFDVEIVILYPWSLTICFYSWYSLWVIIIFLVFLILGFIYEWVIGAINWNTR